jgi:AcrR family transcriptional regulator
MTQPKRLTPDRIVDAALRLIDEDGVEGLTMRRLGASLDVEAMSIYTHFASKGAVLDAVAARLLSRTEMPETKGQDWRNWTENLCANYRRLGLKHPKAFPLLASRRFNAEAGFAFFEAILRVLVSTGLDVRQSIRVARAIGTFLNGAILAEIATASAAEALGRGRPDPKEFPLVAAAAPFAVTPDMDGVFECGLGFILDGVARLARPPDAP